jgi:hypothetical protein
MQTEWIPNGLSTNQKPQTPANQNPPKPLSFEVFHSLTSQNVEDATMCYVVRGCEVMMLHTIDSLRAGRPGDRIPCGGRYFLHPSRPALGPTQLLYNAYRVIAGGKAAKAWRSPPTPSSAEVKERVHLHLYSSDVPLWQVTG